MGIFLPGSSRRPRQFSYEPRYYNPKKEEDIKRRMRVQGRSTHRRRHGPTVMRLVFMVAMLGFAVYLYNSIG